MERECFLIVGYGSIGKRHLQNLRKLRHNAFIVVCRSTITVNQATPVPKGADAIVGSLEDALHFQPKAAIVCNPATFHIEVARTLAENDIPLLIEKPLSSNWEGVEELVALCEEKQLPLSTAYNFRFCSIARFFKSLIEQEYVGKTLQVMIDMGQYLPDWRPESDYRKGVSAQKQLGGGVILELSHEFDYLRWIFGDASSIYAQEAHTHQLDIDVEDNFNALLVMKNGCHANVHMDFLQREKHRQCKVIGSEGTLVWDLYQRTVYKLYQGEKTVLLDGSDSDSNQMYIDELASFLKQLESCEGSAYSFDNGVGTLALLLAARQSILTNSVINVGD